MNLKVNTSIPIRFEEIEDDNDLRFTKVRVFLCHTLENLNGSYFDKSVLERMIPSLSNIPILGYISVDNLNEEDFNGHEERLIIDDNGIKFEYIGRAYGLIPETHNAHFEMKMCDDQVEREFLVCDGLLWNKFTNCIDIFNRDNVKSQSMELQPDSIEGVFGKDKLFHFTSAKFEGACILGDGVIPAMTGSVVEKFSMSDIRFQINEMFDELKQYFQQKSITSEVNITNMQEKGGKNVDEILAMLDKYNLTLENLSSKEINYKDFSLEDLELKVQEIFTSTETLEGQVDNPEIIPVTDFTLTSNQLEDELRRELAEIETVTEDYWGEIYTYPRYYYKDNLPEKNIVIAIDEKNYYLVGFTYTVGGDNVEIDGDSLIRYKVDYNPMDLSYDPDNDEVPNLMSLAKSEFMLQAKEKYLAKSFEIEKEKLISDSRAEFETLQSELNALKEQYSILEERANLLESDLAAKIVKEREDAENTIFESFTHELTEEEMENVKSKRAELSLEDIETKLFALVGKKKAKLNFSKVEEKPVRVNIPTEVKSVSDKEYADLIEKYSKK